MAFWAYMLRCADGHFYVGHTDALEQRIGQHRAGKGGDYTSRRLPVSFAWSETFSTRIEALDAERRIKRWTRAKKEAPIAEDWALMHRLAISREARASTSLSTNGTEGSHTTSVRLALVEEHVEQAIPSPKWEAL